MASEGGKTFVCEYCSKTLSLSNKSKHMRRKHGEDISKKCHPLLAPFIEKVWSESLRDRLRAVDWNGLGTLAEEEVKMWSQSTTGVPQIFRSEDCWHPHVPSYDLVVASMFTTIENSTSTDREYSVYENDRVRGQSAVALCQAFLKPNPERPTYISNINVDLGDSVLEFPIEHVFTSGKEGAIRVNLTPAHSFIDLQTGHGADILATGIAPESEGSNNVYFLFPPTDSNLGLYCSKKHSNQGSPRRFLFLVCASALEGGLIVRTTSTQTLHLPAGTLYAVLAVKTCFLAYQRRLSTTSLITMATYLVAELNPGNVQKEEMVSPIGSYLTCLANALGTSQDDQVESALRSWLLCTETFAKTILVWSPLDASFQSLKERIDGIWKDKSTLVTLSVVLPRLHLECCALEHVPEDSLGHFQENHLL